MKTKRIITIALAAALTAVCAWITVRLPAVSFTMQVFAVYLAAMLLGPADALAALAVYVAVGAAGLPVFSGFQGGLSALAGPTGGYLIGFFFIPLCFFIPAKSRLLEILRAGLGLLICYAFGTAWFVISTGRGLAAALSLCVLPFVLPDAVKIALAWIISARVQKYLK